MWQMEIVNSTVRRGDDGEKTVDKAHTHTVKINMIIKLPIYYSLISVGIFLNTLNAENLRFQFWNIFVL